VKDPLFGFIFHLKKGRVFMKGACVAAVVAGLLAVTAGLVLTGINQNHGLLLLGVGAVLVLLGLLATLVLLAFWSASGRDS
jgi:hypothetical protein